MTKPEPQPEHRWLERLVGNWTFEGEAVMGPDKPPETCSGSESTRSLGGLWVLCEGQMPGPDGKPATTLMTLGYDPAKRKFVGTFVASMMTHLWQYEGTLDAGGTVLTLDCEGPSFAAEGKMANYQDVITLGDDGSRTLTSRFQADDGSWHEFMTSRYRRMS